jgi:hypothetical protein
MEDNLNYFVFRKRTQLFANKRRPKLFCKWMTTSIFWKLEDDLKKIQNGYKLIFFLYGRQTQIF